MFIILLMSSSVYLVLNLQIELLRLKFTCHAAPPLLINGLGVGWELGEKDKCTMVRPRTVKRKLEAPTRCRKICPRAEIIYRVRWRIIVNICPYKGRTFQGLISTQVSDSSDNLSEFCILSLQYSDENYYSSKMNGDFVSFNITPYYSLRKGLTM